jgi:hypothetical protein
MRRYREWRCYCLDRCCRHYVQISSRVLVGPASPASPSIHTQPPTSTRELCPQVSLAQSHSRTLVGVVLRALGLDQLIHLPFSQATPPRSLYNAKNAAATATATTATTTGTGTTQSTSSATTTKKSAAKTIKPQWALFGAGIAAEVYWTWLGLS